MLQVARTNVLTRAIGKVRQMGAPGAVRALTADDTHDVGQVVYLHLMPANDTGIQPRIGTTATTDTSPDGQAWFALCHRLTPQVEHLSSWSALLDLGRCSPAEAMTATGAVVRAIEDLGYTMRAGIAPGLTLAQLATFTAPRDQPLRLLAAAEVPAFLRDIPVTILSRLHPRGVVTSETVARLERFGLRRLGQLARLDESALRRQFGDAGAFLATVAQGRDPRPLHPTPLSPTLCLRVRGLDALPPDRALALAHRLGRRLATILRERGRRTRLLRIQLRRDSGSIERAAITLRQHTDDSRLLAQEIQRLLASLLLPAGNRPSERVLDGIDEIHVTLGDFAPDQPGQGTFWRTHDQRRVAVQVVADGLARRHGRPLLLHSEIVQPAAIFGEERQQLVAIGDLDGTQAHGTHEANVGQVGRRRHPPTIYQQGSSSDPWHDVPQRLHWW